MCQFVTGSIPSQVVPPANIWDATLCDNSYCYCYIQLGNGIVRTVFSYKFLVFCVILSLSPSCFRRFQLVQGGSRLFHLTPAYCRWFQLVPGGSSLFPLVPRFNMYALYLTLVCLHILMGCFTLTTPRKKLHFISHGMKSNVNRIFFTAKQNFTASVFHFGFHENTV